MVAIAVVDHWFAVMQITDRAVMYHGTSLARAAAALEPGTCYGRGTTRQNAYGDCTINRRTILEANPKLRERIGE